MSLSLLFVSSNAAVYFGLLKIMFGAGALTLETTAGFWQYHEPVYRIPVLVAFVIGSIITILWPPRKNLGTLVSCSAAIMLSVLFWYDPGPGVYHMAWFLPLLLLTIFRPNLEDRVALTALSESWFSRWGG